MRIRWRGLELPGSVTRDDTVSTDSYARFIVEPFEQGFGTTIGNSLRRVLLSSLEGAAVTTVKIAGVAHEFASIDGVLEDVTDILLNIKGIVVSLDVDEPKTMSVQRETAGEVRARDIVSDPALTVANPDHLIATLTADIPFQVEMIARTGRGYATANDNRLPEQEIGVIPVDSVFSPVRRVRYRTENMRVGQRTNYDRLILEVWTDRTVTPEDALVEAGLILRKHLNPFVMYYELGEDAVMPQRPAVVEPAAVRDDALEELLDKPVAALNLSARASNCLEAARVATLRELVNRTEQDLLRVRSFGKTSLHEVQRKLADFGLQLGMKVDEDMSIGPGDEAGEGPIQSPEGASGEPPFGTLDPSPGADSTGPPSDDGGSSSPSESGSMEVYTMED
jgi:DNA-directed RNA polymerase subunit alpha